MKFIINEIFDQWIKKTHLNYLKHGVLFNLFGIFTGYAMTLGSDGVWDNNLTQGLGFIAIVLLINFFGFINVEKKMNRIIRIIELNESDLKITLQVDIFFGLFTINKKNIKINYKNAKFSLNEFPIKQTHKSQGLECYFIVSGGEVYYLIHEFFESSLVDSLVEKLNIKL